MSNRANITSRINDVLYHIHSDISAALPAKSLAEVALYSEQHFHRVFAQVVGSSVHQYIRRCRLEYAANQLMFDADRPIIDIAAKAGFVSLSSFGRAFKSVFLVSPGKWRANSALNQTRPYLNDAEIKQAYIRLKNQPLPKPRLRELPAYHVAYVRHEGYGRSISMAWHHLQSWSRKEGRSFESQFALHHSNPACVPLDKCRYVACVEIDEPILKRGVVNGLTIPKGLHAVFRLKGVYGELLPYLSKIFEQWLPQSGFKMLSTPAYVKYHKNHFLNGNEIFELDFCLPVSMFD